ncbi:MAG: phosphate acyltransferase PlsX [Phycisphaerales bacterium]|nr:phosphate acyltransferase PlsX [Phycisphaerales bacterium]
MRIGVDVMGGDNAPDEILKGCIAAVETLHADDTLVLIGDGPLIAETLEERGINAGKKLEIVATTEVIEMDDPPVDSVRTKKNSSISVMGKMGSPKDPNRLDAVISAGNTGACVTAAQMHMRRLPGVVRPGICVTVPTFSGPIVLLDVGANIEPKASHLAQYALMGSAYYGGTFGIPNPKVGILNIGSEELKGNPLVREARALMKQLPSHFHGNVEGVELYSGECHVVVTDGFTGNVVLKVSEGLAEYLVRTMFGLMQKSGVEPERMGAVKHGIMPRIDFSEYGGALLLGVKGCVTICHGRSRAPAFANAIRFACRAMDAKVNDHIVRAARECELPQAEPNA